MAALTMTLSDLLMPHMGISTVLSHKASVSGVTPVDSLPTTRARGKEGSSSSSSFLLLWLNRLALPVTDDRGFMPFDGPNVVGLEFAPLVQVLHMRAGFFQGQ